MGLGDRTSATDLMGARDDEAVSDRDLLSRRARGVVRLSFMGRNAVRSMIPGMVVIA
jgi:hypothetical protein